ncbi:MAG: ATP-grasp domain-containing protein [Phycisphaeraceae bacterium]|nr:ATP-grasp domain-containing protein [Phycisphaeraceae bacterium]
MTNSINILVTGIGGGGVGEQVLKALKLSKHRYTIIGTDSSTLCKNKNEVDYFYILPRAEDKSYVDSVLEITKKHQVKVAIPGSEPELKTISSNRSRLTESGTTPFVNRTNVIDTCLDKFKTNIFLQDNGFLFPKTHLISNLQELIDINFFPVVLKPSTGGGGSVNTIIAQDKNELERFSQYLLNIYPHFIAQEYIGTPEHEYTVSVLSDLKGNFINSIIIKRNILTGLSNRVKIENRTNIKSLGPILAISSGISQGEIIMNKAISDTCENIAAKIGSAGAINIQCRLHNNQVFVFEINPRFSGTTSIRAMAGYNEPDVLIRKEIYNEEIECRFAYKLGTALRGLSETFIIN